MTLRSNHAKVSECDLVTIRCSDFRHTNGIFTLNRAVKERFGLDAAPDSLAKPGGPFALVHGDEHHRRSLLEDLDFLIKSHRFENVLLVPHTGCSRYRQFMKFDSAASERKQLIQDIATAAELIRGRHPDMRVIGCIAEMSPTTLLRLEDVFDSRRTAAARSKST